MNKVLDSKIKQEYIITDLVTQVQGSILNSLKMISLQVLCNKGLRIIKKIALSKGFWVLFSVLQFESQSHKSSGVHGVSSDQFTMQSIARLTCQDVERNNKLYP